MHSDEYMMGDCTLVVSGSRLYVVSYSCANGAGPSHISEIISENQGEGSSSMNHGVLVFGVF